MTEKKGNRVSWVLAAFLIAALYFAVRPIWAAYETQRPISNGKIDQEYLWGEILPPPHTPIIHRGVDLPYDPGTDVLSAVDGWVAGFDETIPDHQGTGLGNYVLIKHEERHWDRDKNLNSYTYSIYAHLKQGSVVPEKTNTYVHAGDKIAEVDDTGTTTDGHHLHFQVNLCPYIVSDPEDPYLNRRETSRNAELWLQPLNGTTGTVLGKYTNLAGNDIGDFHKVVGLIKDDYPGGWPFNDYDGSQTYSYDHLNPDDIFVENWGTTDVSTTPRPLTVQNASATPVWDYGYHTARAGEFIYVGLYPFYLPDTRAGSGQDDWSSYISVRNNVSDRNDQYLYTAQVNSTFFNLWRWGKAANTLFLQDDASARFLPDGNNWQGSGVVVSSQRPAVSVFAQSYDTEAYAYNGIPVQPKYSGFPSQSDLGLAAANTVYMPNYLYDKWDQTTKVFVQNTGRAETDITVTYRNKEGGEVSACAKVFQNVKPWQTKEVDPSSCSSLPDLGSVTLSADQPLAAVTVIENTANNRRSAYNGFRDGSTLLYAPGLLRNAWGWNSSLYIHNLSTSQATVDIKYYKYDGTYICTDALPIPARGTRIKYQGGDSTHTCLYGKGVKCFSARLEVQGPNPGKIIAAIYQASEQGNDQQAYSAYIQGQQTLVFPWIKREDPNDPLRVWDANIQIQNTAGSPAQGVKAYFYDLSGNQVDDLTKTLPAFGGWQLHDFIPIYFEGSVVVVSPYPIAGVASLLRLDISDGAGQYTGMAE